MRDEAPLYYNEKHDFYALSRFEDVKDCSADWKTYISGKGSVLELIKSGMEIPPGIILFEDPPAHDLHRGLLSRVFTPRRMAEIEPQARNYCARTLDPLVEGGRFDFIHDLAAEFPMRVIGMLLGIPEEDQVAIRDRMDEGMRLDEGKAPDTAGAGLNALDGSGFEAYIDWRAEHPSDDLMTDLLNAEFEDDSEDLRKLTREEILNYIGLLAAAGNETTTRLIGWAGKVLAEHPDQRTELAGDPALIPGAIEELLRYESPSPVQARYVTRDVEHHAQKVSEGSVLLLMSAAATATNGSSPTRTASTSTARCSSTWPLGTGSTSAWEATSPGSRAASPWKRFWRVPDLGGRLGQRRAGPHLDGAWLGVATRRRAIDVLAIGARRNADHGSIPSSDSTRAVSAPRAGAPASTGRACG